MFPAVAVIRGWPLSVCGLQLNHLETS
jgi:hypothetical protein